MDWKTSMGPLKPAKERVLHEFETKAPHMQPLLMGERETVTSALVYNATGRDVTDVFVDGRHVVKNGKLQTVDVDKIMKKVQSALEKISRAL